jgi:hypothetical protein
LIGGGLVFIGGVLVEWDALRDFGRDVVHSAMYDMLMDERDQQPSLIRPQPASIIGGLHPENNWLQNTKEVLHVYGAPPRVAGYYFGGYEHHAAAFEAIRQNAAAGVLTMLNWGAVEPEYGKENEDLSEFTTFIESLAALHLPIALRMNYEVNSKHFQTAWYMYENAAHFVAGWERRAQIVQEKGQGRIFLCLNFNAKTDLFLFHSIDDFMPDGGSFEMATLDTFNMFSQDDWANFFTQNRAKHVLKLNISPQDAVAHELALLQKRYPHHPLGVTEFGISREYDRDIWTRQLIEYCLQVEHMRLLMTFDRDETRKEGMDWTVAHDFNLTQAVRDGYTNSAVLQTRRLQRDHVWETAFLLRQKYQTLPHNFALAA